MSEILKYVIIGNGIAGLSAAEEIRKRDEKGTITMVTSENILTYYRVKLSHYIGTAFDDKQMLVHDEKWYQDRNIDVILNQIAEEIKVKENRIRLDNGTELTYDRLLLANGSRPFVPPVNGRYKGGIFALRTIKDLKYMQQYFSICNDITIIGGGLLGLEAAWAIKSSGKNVNVIEFFPYLLPKQLDEPLSAKLLQKLEGKGLNFYLGSAVEEITGDTEADGIKMKDGSEFKTDAVIFSSGVRSSLDLVQDTGIAFDIGVKVNKYLRTNIDNIYAAGDIAEVDGVVLGLWSTAMAQGKAAGQNMAGDLVEYKLAQPFTMLTIAGINVFSAGNIQEYDMTLEHTEEKKEHYYKIYLTNHKITGGILMGDTSHAPKFKKAINDNINVEQLMEKGMGCWEIINSF
ncbi:NAD(P)/FAD-dependent oxidoreductase [Anoxynatronum buryatiense]|uniref:Nitrite reductase (NADH) large subunit n=1 Tax=Anoxynatronum buryatiense TaxID=489973 RepID=A0AA45WX23_9CLOT|nr:FAD-dependent oxidoreductase [Anoxynatronum buryatiense]SMP61995.1 nitrite reductase (NADH) large subunit [Anoxynatronum buryatiense]